MKMLDMNQIISVLVTYLPKLPLLFIVSCGALILFIFLALRLFCEKRRLNKVLTQIMQHYEQQCDYLEWLQVNKDQLSKTILLRNKTSQDAVAAAENMIAQLMENNKTLQKQADAAKQKLDELKAHIDTLTEKEKEIPILRERADELSAQMVISQQNAKAELAVKDEQLAQLQTIVDECQCDNSEKKKQIETLEIKLQEVQLRLRTAQPSSTTEKVYKELQKSCVEKDVKISNLSDENEKLRHVVEELKAQIDDNQHVLADMREKDSGLNTQLNRIETILSEKQHEIESLQKEIAVLQSKTPPELPPSDAVPETLEDELQVKNEQIQRLQATNRQYYHDVHELEQQVQTLTEKLKSYQVPPEPKSPKRSTNTKEYKKLQALCKRKEETINRLLKEIDELKVANETLEEQLLAYREDWDRDSTAWGENPYSPYGENIYGGNLYHLSHDEDE